MYVLYLALVRFHFILLSTQACTGIDIAEAIALLELNNWDLVVRCISFLSLHMAPAFYAGDIVSNSPRSQLSFVGIVDMCTHPNVYPGRYFLLFLLFIFLPVYPLVLFTFFNSLIVILLCIFFLFF